jgi:spermidine synthase
VLTAWKDDLRLFLNSHLQFSSKDEYRYHEALVHPGLSAQPEARRVLVLGGGDGLAVREILKHPRVEHVTLVDLDPEMTRLFSTHPELTKLNHGAFADPRVHVVNADAFAWLEETHDLYDFAVVDFPDPSNYSIGKLYTTAFYGALARHLPPDGRFVVQSTSPLFARKSFWCVVQTVEATRLLASPYHVYVPAFGEWGFVIGGRTPYRQPTTLPSDLRFLTLDTLPELFTFPPDMQRVPVEANHLNTQVLVRYYEQEWDGINR